jgi:iron complex outermembrane receptor protein
MKNLLKAIKISIFCLIALFIFEDEAIAQDCSYTLYGTVKDSSNLMVLNGARISIKETGKIIISDSEGHYHFDKLCSGNYTIVVNFVGYQSYQTEVNLAVNKEINLFLSPVFNQLSGVTVNSTRIEDKPVQINSQLKGKELEITRGETLAEALKRIPGMSTVQTGPSISKPVIHGLHSNRVLIYNAGVRQEGQQWGSEHAPEIDPFIANQLTVVKGASSVMYGADAIGGVILVEPALLNYHQGVSGNINIVGMSNNGQGTVSGMLEGSLNKRDHFSWRVQGTLKTVGNSKTPDYYLRNTGFNEQNASFQFGYKKNKFNSDLFASTFNSRLGIFTGSHSSSTTDLLNAIGRDQPLPSDQSSLIYSIERPYQLINHNVLKIRSGYIIEGIGKVNLQYSIQENIREEYDLVRRSNEGNYQLRFDLTTQALDLFLDHNPISGFTGRLGFSNMFQQNFYDGRFLIPFFDSYNGGLFLIEKIAINKWELEAGMRYDYKWMQARLRENVLDSTSPEIRPEFNFNQISGTLGSSYNAGNGFKFSSTLAKAWRPPAINELFSNGVHHGSATFEKGDPNLKEESSINLTAGISKTGDRFNAEISTYYNRINDYIYLKPSLVPVLTIRGAFPAFQYVQVDSRFTGADFLASWKFNKILSTTAKYSFVRAFNVVTKEHLEFIPADRFTGILNFDLPDFKKLEKNTVDLTATHVARQGLVKAIQDFAPVPESYTLVNADIGTSMAVYGHLCNLSFSIQNVLNTRYRDYLNRFRYYADEPGRNFVLRLKVPFGKYNNTNNTINHN